MNAGDKITQGIDKTIDVLLRVIQFIIVLGLLVAPFILIGAFFTMPLIHASKGTFGGNTLKIEIILAVSTLLVLLIDRYLTRVIFAEDDPNEEPLDESDELPERFPPATYWTETKTLDMDGTLCTITVEVYREDGRLYAYMSEDNSSDAKYEIENTREAGDRLKDYITDNVGL